MKTKYIILLVLLVFMVVYFSSRNNEVTTEKKEDAITGEKADEDLNRSEAVLMKDDDSVDTSHQESVRNANFDSVRETKEQKKRLQTRQTVEKTPSHDNRTDRKRVKLNDPVFSRPFLNDIDFSSTSEESEFLARNELENIRNWRQLSHINTKHQDLETLKGRYTGIAQRSERSDLLAELTIDVEENKIVGNMAIRSLNRKESSQHPHLKGELRVVEKDDVISVAIFATGHNPSAAFQLFFQKENPSKVIGNIYGNHRGTYERMPIWLQRNQL